jgi:AraC-like DNA-binding protein
MAEGALVPVLRSELVTADMDEMAEVLRRLYFEHTARFSCDDPGRVDGALLSADVAGLSASIIVLGGFTYTSVMDPADAPTAVILDRGGGSLATAAEQVGYGPGDAVMIPAAGPGQAVLDDGGYLLLRVPWQAVRSLAAEQAGVPGASVRFESMAVVSAASQRVFTRTAEFIRGQFTAPGVTGVPALVVPELMRLAAAAFLETFPNTTMTAGYSPGPGWAPPAAVDRAVGYIIEHAGEPVSVDDVAAAAGVTSRALQVAFRRYYDVTLAGYLRRVRLERAHLDLRDAEPGDGVTVAAVAAAWGWASPSRFAADYRQRFGIPPSRTLRG